MSKTCLKPISHSGLQSSCVALMLCVVTVLSSAACGGSNTGTTPATGQTETSLSSNSQQTTALPRPTPTEVIDDKVEVSPQPSDAENTSPGDLTGSIVFTSERDGVDDLYVMDADGGNVKRLTETDRNEWWGGLSPDGSAIVFGRNYTDRLSTSTGLRPHGIFILRPGEEPIDLTDDSAWNSLPRWSPDGSRILFNSDRTGETIEIFVMDADGGNVQQLTETGTSGSAGGWSPDGSQVVISATAPGREDRDIFIMNADGSGLTRLTEDPGNDSRASWSPDGSWILFDSDRDGDREIFLIHPDGTGIQQLTDNADRDDFASWSPDGQAIAFTSNRDGNLEIYVMKVDGSGQANLSQTEADELFPSWSGGSFE
jgi:Tol biopolymer transport system component